jgi:signal transduction histidine kinase
MDNQQRLLHDVSHELRSPLARLHAAIGLAHQTPDKLASSLERIERESNRMDKLVGELLTLSRLDSAINLPPLEEVAIGELVHEIAAEADFEAELSGRRVHFVSLASGSAGNGAAAAQVLGSPDLLWRGIENIVRNAVKYSPPGGVVEIEVQQTLAADDNGAGRVCVKVRDRGPGVPEAHLASIFQPFFRSDPTSNNVDGHGLGLAIAQRVIAAHGGTLSARNRIGGGLCVTIELPSKGPTPR